MTSRDNSAIGQRRQLGLHVPAASFAAFVAKVKAAS
ncbi:hypothetical protein JOF56_001598 [Kibdelosporangium banguiense]|uniref:DUF397 domain-containing protein n=1 Tax=Kibdelosporangium banguiense TaxID=1365924 RepID=A0ABS4T9V6_9PSEU|nr:hypothetical protein [Kibdelosporangium banguiense]